MKKSLILCGIIFALFIIYICSTALQHEVITTNTRGDGFGAQVQQVIANFVYAEMNNKEFCYRPLSKVDHNYDDDPNFTTKKEWLLNFIDNVLTVDEAIKKNYRIITGNYISFLDKNIARCQKALDKIKKIFRANKKSDNYFNNNNLNIAIHVRRPVPCDEWTYGTDIPNDHYINIMNKLRIKYSSGSPLFHIYSTGNSDQFSTYQASDVVLHLNECVEDTYQGLVFADVLVTGRSSFSYTAGYLSDGIVYYNSYMHAPLPHWISIEMLLTE